MSRQTGIRLSEDAFTNNTYEDDACGVNTAFQMSARHCATHTRILSAKRLTNYLHLCNRDIVICRFPERAHRFTDLIMAPTLRGMKELFQRNYHTLCEVTQRQHQLVSDGARIYSAARFNFVQVRDFHSHTWNVDDGLLLANSNVHSFGLAVDITASDRSFRGRREVR